jgi:hypothetical protein
MTVENPAVIDFVAHDPSSDVVSFVLVEHRAWGDQGRLLPDLQRKLNTYLGYALDGKFAEAYPQHRGKRIRFDLRTAYLPGARELEFFELIQKQDLGPRGIELSWRQFELGDLLSPEAESGGQ